MANGDKLGFNFVQKLGQSGFETQTTQVHYQFQTLSPPPPHQKYSLGSAWLHSFQVALGNLLSCICNPSLPSLCCNTLVTITVLKSKCFAGQKAELNQRRGKANHGVLLFLKTIQKLLALQGIPNVLCTISRKNYSQGLAY